MSTNAPTRARRRIILSPVLVAIGGILFLLGAPIALNTSGLEHILMVIVSTGIAVIGATAMIVGVALYSVLRAL